MALTTSDPAPRQLVGRDARLAAALVRVLPNRLLARFVAAGGATG
jgi:hypothetical protein